MVQALLKSKDQRKPQTWRLNQTMSPNCSSQATTVLNSTSGPPPPSLVCEPMTEQEQQQSFRTSALKNFLEKVFLTCQAWKQGAIKAWTRVLTAESSHMAARACARCSPSCWCLKCCENLPSDERPLLAPRKLSVYTRNVLIPRFRHRYNLPFIIWLEFIRGLMTNKKKELMTLINI